MTRKIINFMLKYAKYNNITIDVILFYFFRAGHSTPQKNTLAATVETPNQNLRGLARAKQHKSIEINVL